MEFDIGHAITLLEFYYINEPSVVLQKLILANTLIHLLPYFVHPKVKHFFTNILSPQNSMYSIPSIIRSKLYNYLYIIKYSNAFSELVLSRMPSKIEVDEAKIELINQNILYVNRSSNLLNLHFNRIEEERKFDQFYKFINLPNIDALPADNKQFIIDIKT